MHIDREPNRQENPIPRKAPNNPVPSSRNGNIDRLFLYQRGQVSWDQVAGFRGGQRRQGHKLMLWSWLAICIDGLVLFSFSSSFVIMFALIMRLTSVHHLGFNPIKLFAACYITGAWLYMIGTRILFGFSIGEWACDLRLGQPTQRLKSNYFFKVLVRASSILFSGTILLPALSLLLGKDLAGEISGVKIISLK